MTVLHKWRDDKICFILLISLCLYSPDSITPLPSSMLRCPMSTLTFDSGQCFKGSALCPLPFDLSEVYLYNCPCRYQMHIWEGAGAGGRSLSNNLLASRSSILLRASTAGFLPLPAIPYCISLHVGVIDGALEIFYWSVMTFDWGNANTNPPKASYRHTRTHTHDQMANRSIDLEWPKC